MTSDSWGRQGLDYISLRVQREPLDQIDLSNGLDASSKVVGDRYMKLANRWTQEGPSGPTYRSGTPTCQGVFLCFGDMASRPL